MTLTAIGALADLRVPGVPIEGDVFARTRVLQLLSNMEWVPISEIGVPQGWERPSGVPIFTPTLVATPGRVWACACRRYLAEAHGNEGHDYDQRGEYQRHCIELPVLRTMPTVSPSMSHHVDLGTLLLPTPLIPAEIPSTQSKLALDAVELEPGHTLLDSVVTMISVHPVRVVRIWFADASD